MGELETRGSFRLRKVAMGRCRNCKHHVACIAYKEIREIRDEMQGKAR